MPDVLARATGPVALEVRAGEVVLLEGPNGSGKTSLLRALAGLPSPLPIAARLHGADPALLDATTLATKVSAALQDPHDTLVGLTVAGEFRLRAKPLPDHLKDLADRDVATLSSGEARRTSLAVAAGNAPLLLLDEPSEGLDAERRGDLLALVAAARQRGAVVAADHSGLLAAVATRRVALAPTPPVATFTLPPATGKSVVQMPAQTGAHGVRLPAIDLPAGLHGVAGPNGAGKSTLLLTLAETFPDSRLLLPRAGDLLTQPTVAREVKADPHGFVPARLLPRHPLTLSAGEAKRVALAKTFARPAPLVLLDEPEAHLDADGRDRLLAAIASSVAAGSCVLAATHDPALLAACSSVVQVGA